MNRRKFVGACCCCAFTCAGLAFLNKNPKILNEENEFLMHHVGVHIAEHCNLSCKYCCHFSCIAEKEFYDLDKFKQDMDKMSSVLDKKLVELQLLGGEPLLNPQINEYTKYSRECFPKTRINIITNATLLDNMDKTFWETLNENEINIVPSLYPIKINWSSILDKAEKYNVGIYGYYDCKEKLTLSNIDRFQKPFFYKMKLDKNTNDNIDKSKCYMRPKCTNMYNGKLYPCTIIAYIRHFNKKFNKDFYLTENDYLDLYKVKNISEVEKFLKTTQFPFCKYCIPDNEKVMWENSKEHLIDEWT